MNKDGVLDKIEQEEAMKTIHSFTLPQARWTWSGMDTDGDGTISADEFRKGMQAISDKIGEEQLLDSIIRAWTDHPLALEKAKWVSFHDGRVDFPKAISDLFKMLDRNKDGVFTSYEQDVAAKKIHSMKVLHKRAK